MRLGFICLAPKKAPSKEGAPMRPIISPVKTYNYQLAKHLNDILQPLVNNEFILKTSL